MRKNMPRDFVRGKANAVFDALRPPSWPCRDSRLMTRSGYLAPCLPCRRADSDERVSPLHFLIYQFSSMDHRAKVVRRAV